MKDPISTSLKFYNVKPHNGYHYKEKECQNINNSKKEKRKHPKHKLNKTESNDTTRNLVYSDNGLSLLKAVFSSLNPFNYAKYVVTAL